MCSFRILTVIGTALTASVEGVELGKVHNPMKDKHALSETFDPLTITRPAPVLLTYYILSALITGPALLITLPYLYFKYHTLRYKLDDSGVSMSWGIFFRREIHLTYRRIQDIHLTKNIVQRWMGLATINIQTASGGSGPEMSIEGILSAGPLRDYLYSRMRGAYAGRETPTHSEATHGVPAKLSDVDGQSLALLREIRDLLKHISSREKGDS